jgi:hypothetical protein
VQKYTAQSFKRAKVDMPTKLEFVSSKTIQKYPKAKLLIASQLGRSPLKKTVQKNLVDQYAIRHLLSSTV